MSNEEKELKNGQKRYLQSIVNSLNKEAKKVIDEFNDKSQKKISEVDRLKESLSIEIENTKSSFLNFEDKLNTLDKLYNTLFYENNEGLINTEEIEEYVSKFKTYKKEVESYSEELFGYEDDEGNKVNGEKHKIESLKGQLQLLIKDNQEKLENHFETNANRQEELFSKIESLLKGASTVALAKAFKEHKDSFNVSNYIWMGLFVVSIISMMGLSLWGFINANYEFKDMWKYTLGNLPFIAGAVWLAIYSSKQRSQNRRLQQEYAFKEDVAKIYYGLKEEIEELGDSELGIKLNESVLKLVIGVVSLNPSETLDSKTHNDNGPVLDSLKSISSLIKESKTPL